MSWPLAYLRNLRAHSASIAAFEDAKAKFLVRLQDSHVPKDVIGWISAQTCHVQAFLSMQRALRLQIDSHVLWLPLQYRPYTASRLHRTLKQFFESSRSIELLSAAVERSVRLDGRFAWTLYDKCFSNSLVAW